MREPIEQDCSTSTQTEAAAIAPTTRKPNQRMNNKKTPPNPSRPLPSQVEKDLQRTAGSSFGLAPERRGGDDTYEISFDSSSSSRRSPSEVPLVREACSRVSAPAGREETDSTEESTSPAREDAGDADEAARRPENGAKPNERKDSPWLHRLASAS